MIYKSISNSYVYPVMIVTNRRTHIVADAIGSVRAAGLEPGATVIEILDRWVDGAIGTEQLGEAAELLAAGKSVERLLNS
jgi:hypothetical protein